LLALGGVCGVRGAESLEVAGAEQPPLVVERITKDLDLATINPAAQRAGGDAERLRRGDGADELLIQTPSSTRSSSNVLEAQDSTYGCNAWTLQGDPFVNGQEIPRLRHRPK
jgi:hypothetical protein